MHTLTQNSLLVSEERLKENVYTTFDKMTSEASDNVRKRQKDVDEGAFDDKEGFMEYGKLSSAQEQRRETEQLVNKLYNQPYFAHIEVSFEDDPEDRENYFLSDCESLDRAINIGNTSILLPFKRDKERKISEALFHCYQAKKGEPISYLGSRGEKFTFIPQLICNTTIRKRRLKDVVSLYPQIDVSQISADELLELKLQENRDNPTLRNIIATLQRMQFEIIETDTNQSFVVQGCAGSGKSQCMIHRLFYLRDVLAQDGWNKVLLITPTELFRQYSADLIRRYQLSDINNYSIADLYRDILMIYDTRFKDRQYVYQMTEEYLPDEYLVDVYNDKNVISIEEEIDSAIFKYVKNGCDVLGIDIPEHITHVEIENIISLLEEQTRIYDEREKALQDNKEYQEKRRQYEQLLKATESNQKKYQKYRDDLQRNKESQIKLDKLSEAVEDAERERTQWIEQREQKIVNAIKELEVLSKKVERGTDLQAPAKYSHQIYIVKELTEGLKFQEDEEYLIFLDEYCGQAKNELNQEIGDKKVSLIKKRLLKRQVEIESNIKQLVDNIDIQNEEIFTIKKWLCDITKGYEGEDAKNALLRSEIESARYFLSRIESTVFEKEVWNALAPVKQKYGIQTVEVEDIRDGKHKESRILYKSDLLFYVKIYMKLHPDMDLPEYSLICIDEGQDLHRADYDIMHRLYPEATFNVFGDVNQVLHSACGVTDWVGETGISDIRLLSTNYRNTAAIVDFCNNHFDVQMDYIGSILKEHEPVIITDKSKIRKVIDNDEIVVIVRDRNEYEEFCNDAGINEDYYVYMDTLSEKCDNKRRECYSIFAAKGLEFKNVFVYSKNMTRNQKVVACTRAMGGLYYYE